MPHIAPFSVALDEGDPASPVLIFAPKARSPLVVTDLVIQGGRVYRATVDLDREDARLKIATEVARRCGVSADAVGDILQQAAAAIANERDAPRAARDADDGDAELYVVSDGRLCWRKPSRDGYTLVPLANFSAAIVEEIVRDDGLAARGELVIAGTLADGTPLPPVRVARTAFGEMDWVLAEWGTRAIVAAGPGIKDHLRAAIQCRSTPARRSEYGHTGWRQIDGDWCYLHAGGAIGAGGARADIGVHLGGGLARTILPAPPTGDALIVAIRASLAVLDVAPDTMTVPLLAAVYRAPLIEVAPADFALFLTGGSGARKSELAALAQRHFGAGFDRLHLPASWESTANALERLLFEGKDMLVTIDDFCPRGRESEVQALHGKADRAIRSAGNGSARGRMNADGTLRPDLLPRGVILGTGEDVPKGQSLQARMEIIEVAKGAVRLDRLTAAQAAGDAGQYAAAMAGYLAWLAPRIEALRAGAATAIARLRTLAIEQGGHARTPGVVAQLGFGWKTFLDFAAEVGALTVAERRAFDGRITAALHALAAAQPGNDSGEEPAQKFLDLLVAALSAGVAHVAKMDGSRPEREAARAWGWWERAYDYGSGEWMPQGDRIGWTDGETLYLEGTAAYRAAQRMGGQSDGLVVGQVTLWKRVQERGLLAREGGGTEGARVKITVEGRRRQRAYALPVSLVLEVSQPPLSGPVQAVSSPAAGVDSRVF